MVVSNLKPDPRRSPDDEERAGPTLPQIDDLKAKITNESLEPETWVALPSRLASDRDFIVGGELCTKILAAGGRLALLSEGYKVERQDSSPSDLRWAPWLDGWYDRCTIIRCLSQRQYLDAWPRDFFGIPVQTGSECAPSLLGICNDERDRTRLLAKFYGPPVDPFPLQIQGGNFVPLGDGIVLVTTSVLRENSNRSEDEIRHVFASYGRPHLIIVDPIEHSPEHADFIVAQLGTTAFVPFIQKEAFHHCTSPAALRFVQERLDDAANRLSSLMCVERLPMPVPLVPFDAVQMVSPVNWRQVRNKAGEITVIVPWATHNDDLDVSKFQSSKRPQWREWADHALHSEYKEAIASKLIKAGAAKVEFLPCDPRRGGALHCCTIEIPDAVVSAIPLDPGDELS